MSIVHRIELDGPAAFACAQSKCPECQDRLVRRHEGLVHVVLRRQARSDVAYEDLLQAGRIGLWQAVLHFDPHRGVAFSTYAGVAIERHIWQAVRQANRPQGWLPLPQPPDPAEMAEEQVWWEQVETALDEAVSRLPDRLRQVIGAVYGLDGHLPCSLAAIGRECGITREMARYWHNQAVLCLRLPVFSARLRQLWGQDSRAAYARAQALNRAWQRQRRSYRRPQEVRR
jgi:RNA polymerase sigma factor (sigma-70 family)